MVLNICVYCSLTRFLQAGGASGPPTGSDGEFADFVIDAVECLETLVIQYVIWGKGTELSIAVATDVLFDYGTFLQTAWRRVGCDVNIMKHIYT